MKTLWRLLKEIFEGEECVWDEGKTFDGHGGTKVVVYYCTAYGCGRKRTITTRN